MKSKHLKNIFYFIKVKQIESSVENNTEYWVSYEDKTCLVT